MTTKDLSADRRTSREDCEMKIKSAFRRGLMATCEIARELRKIYSEGLFKDITDDFNEYVTEYLQIAETTYHRILAVNQTIEQFQEAGLELPANETQAAELARLDAPQRLKVWNELITDAERKEKKLTVQDVKEAVETVEQHEPPARVRKAVEIEMEDNGSEPPAAKKPATEIIALTEKGEAALNRIRKICGNQIADSIEEQVTPLTEREIRAWAECEDAVMKSLIHFVAQRWPVSKALAFVSKPIEGSTDVEDLMLIARSKGGMAVINFNDRAKITVELYG